MRFYATFCTKWTNKSVEACKKTGSWLQEPEINTHCESKKTQLLLHYQITLTNCYYKQSFKERFLSPNVKNRIMKPARVVRMTAVAYDSAPYL